VVNEELGTSGFAVKLLKLNDFISKKQADYLEQSSSVTTL
jgi:hypothetical protein